MTREGWAAVLGYGRTTVQRWETGETVPDATAEATIIALTRERTLFRTFDRGPLAAQTATPEWLRVLLPARSARSVHRYRPKPGRFDMPRVSDSSPP